MQLFDLTPLLALFDSLWLGISCTIALGFVIGILSSLFGIGGGFILVPYLHAGLGLAAVPAIATSIGQMPFASAAGCWKFFKEKQLPWAISLWMLAGALPASQIAAYALNRLSSQPFGQLVYWHGLTKLDLGIMSIFVLSISALAILNLWQAKQQRYQPQSEPNSSTAPLTFKHKNFNPWGIFRLGVVFGSLSIILGIGGGFFSFPYLVYRCGLSTAQAVAVGLFSMVVIGTIATCQYISHLNIALGISLLIALGGIIGAQVGAKLHLSLAKWIVCLCLGIMQLIAVGLYLATKLL